MADTGAVSAHKMRFERVVAPWRNDLFRYVFWLCRDPDLAEDVVQETMLRAFNSIGNLADEGAVKPWLFTIARREHARMYERKRLDLRDIDDLSAAEAALIARGDDDTDISDMRAAIFRLEEEYREPLVLQVLVGLSTEEIARTMNLKQGAVLTRLHRARKKLIEQIEPEFHVIKSR